MGKRVYLVRHCQAKGQEMEAKLTEEGQSQAQGLVEFFATIQVDRIISSPFRRAIESVTPLAIEKGIEVELDDRLSERVLSSENLVDWQEKLEKSFLDMDITYPGGESSHEAMERGLDIFREVTRDKSENIVLATHGNLMALLLKAFDPSFSYEDWKQLSNPDIYLIEPQNKKLERIWKLK